MLSALVLLFTFMTCTVSAGVAPGDEKPVCSTLRAQGAAPTPAYSANMRVLMDSWNYQNLLPARTGAVWDQVDYDVNNNAGLVTKVSYMSLVCCILNNLPDIIGDHFICSGFSSPTLHANKLSKCVGSGLVDRTTG